MVILSLDRVIKIKILTFFFKLKKVKYYEFYLKIKGMFLYFELELIYCGLETNESFRSTQGTEG